jgi:hypothetical protein
VAIIVTKDGEEGARRLDISSMPQESFLQDYVIAHPEIMPLQDIRSDLRVLLVAKEFPTPSGPIDALGLDDQGNVYIVETKLFRNPDKRRVLAQVLDYGASLWRLHEDPRTFRDLLEDESRKIHTEPLPSLLAQHFEMDEEAAEDLLRISESVVQNGSFRFVVLMDQLEDRLKDLISFINENSRFDVFGVEADFYRFEDYQIFIPRLYGAEARKAVPTPTEDRRSWNEKRYFEHARQQLPTQAVESLRRLYDFAVGHADRVTWGKGLTTGSFNLKYKRIHPTKSLLSVFSNGRLELNFAWLHEPGQPLPEEVQRFSERLDLLEGFSLPAGYETSFVQMKADVWVPQVEKLIEAISRSIYPSMNRPEEKEPADGAQ